MNNNYNFAGAFFVGTLSLIAVCWSITWNQPESTAELNRPRARTQEELFAIAHPETPADVMPPGYTFVTDGTHFSWMTPNGSSMAGIDSFSSMMGAARDARKFVGNQAQIMKENEEYDRAAATFKPLAEYGKPAATSSGSAPLPSWLPPPSGDIQIVSATFTAGGHVDDVTARVAELIGPDLPAFNVDVPTLKATRISIVNKQLRINYKYQGGETKTYQTRNQTKVSYQTLVDNATKAPAIIDTTMWATSEGAPIMSITTDNGTVFEIGLRSDHTVVWRPAPAPKPPHPVWQMPDLRFEITPTLDMETLPLSQQTVTFSAPDASFWSKQDADGFYRVIQTKQQPNVYHNSDDTFSITFSKP